MLVLNIQNRPRTHGPNLILGGTTRPGPSQGNWKPRFALSESNESCGQTKALEQNQHCNMDLKRVDMVDHKVRRTQRHRHHGNFASHRDNPPPQT